MKERKQERPIQSPKYKALNGSVSFVLKPPQSPKHKALKRGGLFVLKPLQSPKYKALRGAYCLS